VPRSERGPGWSAAHHRIDPSAVPLLGPWLGMIDMVARPLIRLRVPPDALTAAGVIVSLTVPALAMRGWLWPAAVAVLVSVLLDGLDAVAVGTGRVSGYGRALDSWCDRVSELAWWVALVGSAGVLFWQALVFGLGTVAMETWRALTGRYGAITVWERPSRAVLTVVGLLAVMAAEVAFTGAATGWVGVALAVVGAVQLARHAR